MAGRRFSQSKISGGLSTPSDRERSKKEDVYIDLEDADPYNFVGSQSLQVLGDKSNSVGQSVKKQSNLVQYTSSTTPASMRTIRIANKKGMTTPVRQIRGGNKTSQPRSANRAGKTKRSPASLTERERLELKEREDLKHAMEASLRMSEREERHRRRLADVSEPESEKNSHWDQRRDEEEDTGVEQEVSEGSHHTGGQGGREGLKAIKVSAIIELKGAGGDSITDKIRDEDYEEATREVRVKTKETMENQEEMETSPVIQEDRKTAPKVVDKVTEINMDASQEDGGRKKSLHKVKLKIRRTVRDKEPMETSPVTREDRKTISNVVTKVWQSKGVNSVMETDDNNVRAKMMVSDFSVSKKQLQSTGERKADSVKVVKELGTMKMVSSNKKVEDSKHDPRARSSKEEGQEHGEVERLRCEDTSRTRVTAAQSKDQEDDLRAVHVKKRKDDRQEGHDQQDCEAQDRLILLAKMREVESDSEAEYVLGNVRANKSSPLHRQTVADSQTIKDLATPAVVSEVEPEVEGQPTLPDGKTPSPSPAKVPKVYTPNLKVVKISKLRLKKSVKTSVDSVLQQKAGAGKGDSTPKLEGGQSNEPRSKTLGEPVRCDTTRRWSNPTPPGRRFLVMRKSEVGVVKFSGVGVPKRLSSCETNDNSSTPPLSGVTASLSPGEGTGEGGSRQLLSKRTLFQTYGSEEKDSTSKLPSTSMKSVIKAKSQSENIARPSSSKAQYVRSDTFVTEVDKPLSAVMESRADKMLSSVNTTPLDACKQQSSKAIQNQPCDDPKMSADFKSPASDTSNDPMEAIFGSARTRILSSVSLKRVKTMPTQKSHDKDGTQSAQSRGKDTKSARLCGASDPPRAKVSAEQTKGNEDKMNITSSRKHSHLESSSTSQQKKAKMDESLPPRVERADHLKPKGSSTDMSEEDARRHKAYSPPLFFAHGGIAPADYSKIILNSLNSYISLLAAAQSKVVNRIKWGKPITTAPRRSQDSSTRSTRASQTQEWKYALKLDSKRGYAIDDVQAPEDFKCGSDERDTVRVSAVSASSSEHAKDNHLSPLTPDPERASQATQGNQEVMGSDTGDEFIPLLSYQEEDSDDNQRGSMQYTAEGGCVTSMQDKTLRSVSVEKDATRVEPHNSPSMGHVGEVQPIPAQDSSKPSAHEDAVKECVQVITQEAVKGDFLEAIGDTTTRGLLSEDSSLSSPPQEQAGNIPKRKKIVKKRSLLQDFNESDTMSDDEDGGAGRLKSPWLNSRKRALSASTPPAKKTKVGKVSSVPRREGKKNVTGSTKKGTKKDVQGRRRSKKTSAAARLLLSRREKRGKDDISSGSDLDSPDEEEHPSPYSKREETRKRTTTYDLLGSLSPDSDVDTPEECTVPDKSTKSHKLSTPGNRSSKKIRDKHLPSDSDSDFEEPTFFRGPERKKKKSNCTIDLTSEARPVRTNTNKEEEEEEEEDEITGTTSSSRQMCPVCGEQFDEREFEQHSVACMKSSTGKDKNFSKCVICGKTFASSLIDIHIEQCSGSSSRSSSDEEPLFHKTKKLSEPAGPSGEKRTSARQLTLRVLKASMSQDIDDDSEDDGDVIEISDNDGNCSPDVSVDSAIPRAVPCDDGGYMVEPSTNSPIRSFTRLQDMDWTERSRYQNQFKKKTVSRKGNVSSGIPSRNRGDSGRSGWTKKSSNKKGRPKNFKFNWKNKTAHK